MNLGGYQIIDLMCLELTGQHADPNTGVINLTYDNSEVTPAIIYRMRETYKHSKKPILLRGLNILLQEDDRPEILNPMHEQHITKEWMHGYIAEMETSDDGLSIVAVTHVGILFMYVVKGVLTLHIASRFLSDDSLSQEQADERYVNVTGDTMTGDLNMNNSHINMMGNTINNVGDPVENGDAVPKGWAEKQYVNAAGDKMTGDLNMQNNTVTGLKDPVNPTDAVPKGWADKEYINAKGDTMEGPLNMDSYPIQGLPDTPTMDNEATSKKYVDGEIAKLGNVLNFKGSKDTFAELPMENNKVGDVWYVKERDTGYVWVVDATDPTGRWEEFGPALDLSEYLRKDELADKTGNRTDTTMTQKAITEALKKVKPPAPDLTPYLRKDELAGSTGDRTDTTMTQKAITDALKNVKPPAPDLTPYLRKDELAGSTGDRTDTTMTQKAITDIIKNFLLCSFNNRFSFNYKDAGIQVHLDIAIKSHLSSYREWYILSGFLNIDTGFIPLIKAGTELTTEYVTTGPNAYNINDKLEQSKRIVSAYNVAPPFYESFDGSILLTHEVGSKTISLIFIDDFDFNQLEPGEHYFYF